MRNRTSVITLILAALFLLAMVTNAWAIKITLFTDTDTFIARAKDIVIVEVTGIGTNDHDDGLYAVDINILMTLKGDKAKGKTTLATIYPAEKGKRYLVSSLGGSALGTDLLAVPELSLVPLPADLELKSFESKTLKEQVSLVFQRRLAEVNAAQKALAEERTLLKKTVEPHHGLWAAVTVPEPVVPVDHVGTLMVHFDLVNDTNKPLNPKVNSWTLVINGKPYVNSGILFGNGRNGGSETLPAGARLHFGYGLGNLFKKPGTYTISWKGEDFESAPFVFRVIADSAKTLVPAASGPTTAAAAPIAPPYTDEEAMTFAAKLPDIKYPTTMEAACKMLGIDSSRLGKEGLGSGDANGRTIQFVTPLSPKYWISFQYTTQPNGTSFQRVVIFDPKGK